MAYKRTSPQPVNEGGTGAQTLTANSVLLGNGTSAVSAVGTATNGQLIIGYTSGAPVLATLTAGTDVTITNAPGSITINFTGGGGGGSPYTYVNVSPYYVQLSDNYLAVDTGDLAVNLVFPTTAPTGQFWIVKDTSGYASTDNITLTVLGGSGTIDGQYTYTMNTNYQALEILFDGTTYEIF